MKQTLYVHFIIMTLICSKMVAQDIHFSQFYASPLTLSPAQTGWYKGDMRVAANYRSQWKSIDNKPFSTVGMSFEKQFHFFSNAYAFGIQLVSDESGYVGLLAHKLMVSGAFTKLHNGHKVTIGLQSGGVYKTTNTLRYTYDNQYDLGGSQVFNPGIVSGEVQGEPIRYALVNAGMLWSKRISNKVMPEAGFSLFNINTPHESFYELAVADAFLPMRTAVHVGGKYSLHQKLHVCPNVLYMTQKKASEFLLGANLEYDIQDDITVFGGTSIRYGLQQNFDASSWIGGIEYKRFRIGLSYDVNISGLRTATNNRGAFEVSCIYITPSIQSTFIKIPCDRL